MKKLGRFEMPAAWTIFVLTALIGLYRLFFGVSVADESLYTALADFPRTGATWFVDDLTIQQTSAILISPIVSLYTLLFGTEAVTLFTRLLYLACAVGTALVLSRFFARLCRPSTAVLLAACFVAYIPFGMACLYYNTMGSQGFAVAAVLSILGLTERNKWLLFWGAFFWVLCVFSYPTAMLTFLLFVALAAVLRRKDLAFSRVKYFAAGLLIPGTVLGGVLLWCGVDNIAEAVRVSNNFNMPFQLYKILFGLKVLSAYLPPWWALIPTFAIWIALIVMRPQYSYAGMILFLLCYILTGGTGEGSRNSILWPFSEVMVVLVLARQWKALPAFAKSAVHLFIVPAIVGSVVSWMTSRMTVYNMHGTGISAALATFALASRQNFAAGWSIALLVLGFTLWQHNPYEDAPMPKLEHMITKGPFKYLRTNHDKWKTLEALQDDLNKMPQQGTILFKDTFPGGYLMTGLKPVGPMINILPAFLHPEARPLFYEMFQNRERYFTDFVVEFRFFPMSAEDWVYMDENPEQPTNEFFMREPFHNFFMKSGEYQVILDRGVYRILQRIPR